MTTAEEMFNPEREPIGADAEERKAFNLRISEMNLVLRLALAKLQQVDNRLMAAMSHEQQEEVFKNVAELAELASQLSARCTFCRRYMTKPLGLCAHCGRPVCAECGHTIGRDILHRGNCTRFHQPLGAVGE